MLCANHAVGGMRRCTEPPRRGPPPAPPHTLRGSARSPGARPQKQFPYSVETTVSATQHRLRLHHPSGQQLAAIYPVASSDLPGPSPTRQSAGTSSRVAGIVSHPARPGHPVQTTFPHRNRLLLQCLASLHGRNRIPSGPLAVSSRNAAHHSPDSGSGLAPATPAQGGCWGCQLTAARCSRAAAVIASAAANNSRSRAASCSEGGPSSLDPRRASARFPYRTAARANCARAQVCAFRSSGMLAVLIDFLRAPYCLPIR